MSRQSAGFLELNMAGIESCFLAIPIDEYQPQYASLVDQVGRINPDLVLGNPKIPHATTHYLGSLNSAQVAEIVSYASISASHLSDTTLTIGGYGYETSGESSRSSSLLHLPVHEDCGSLWNFRYELLSVLLAKQRQKSEKRRFALHVTLGYVRPNVLRSFQRAEQRIKEAMQAVSWSLRVKELALYGKVLGSPNTEIQRLETIPLYPECN